MTDSAPTTDTIGGYRVIRKLGTGSRSDVFLGVGDGDTDGESTVALKVFHPHTPSDSISREIDIMASLSSAHAVSLLDVATDPDGRPVPVLARIPGGSLAHVLSVRGGSLTVGEAITVLAPLVGVVAEMEAAGLVHGNISAANIRFGAAGEPILLGFGHAVRLVPGSASVAEIAGNTENDRERVAAVTCLVLSSLAADEPPVVALRDWIVALPRPFPPDFLAHLQDRLFDLGEALPIDFEEGRPAGDSRWPALPRPEAFTGVNGPALKDSQRRRGRFGRIWSRSSRPNVWGDNFLSAAPWAEPLSRLTSALRAVRPRFWILGVVSAVLLGVTALPLLWAGNSGEPPHSAVEPNSQVVPGAVSVPPAESPGATLPDDPVLAFPALLAERERCIDDLSVVCLEGVDQQESSALASDRALIGGIQGQSAASGAGDSGTGDSGASEEIRRRAAWAVRISEGCALVERRGDSALVRCGVNSEPASVLMIRSEAGWRVRELLDEE